MMVPDLLLFFTSSDVHVSASRASELIDGFVCQSHLASIADEIPQQPHTSQDSLRRAARS